MPRCARQDGPNGRPHVIIERGAETRQGELPAMARVAEAAAAVTTTGGTTVPVSWTGVAPLLATDGPGTQAVSV